MSDRGASINATELAATVVLVRQSRGQLETYLLRRSPEIRFMPGMHVFPGGRVDPGDSNAERWKDLIDLSPNALARSWGGDLTIPQALGCAIATVRETYEEVGVLLATGTSGDLPDTAQIDRLRAVDGLNEGWLAEHARSSGWSLSLSSLARWSRWVTPAGMNRRFDTLFFVAQPPADQPCRPDGRETVAGLWISPAAALSKNLSGEIPLSPPTIVTLHELRQFKDLSELGRELPSRLGLAPVTPRLVLLERGSVIVEPWDPEFGQEEVVIRSAHLEDRVLPAGAPFSRIWFNGKLWRPINV